MDLEGDLSARALASGGPATDAISSRRQSLGDGTTNRHSSALVLTGVVSGEGGVGHARSSSGWRS